MNKKIVVGIDFSDCSLKALAFAITIAQKFRAGVTMVWVRHQHYPKKLFSVDEKKLFSKVEQWFHELIQEHTSQLPGQPFEYVILKGKVYDEICALAEELDAFLVVLGVHGVSGLEAFWMGRNTKRVISICKRPIIILRAEVDVGRGLERIVMPLDRTKETRQKIPMTTTLARSFNSEVHILGLSTSSMDDSRGQIRKYVAQAEDCFREHNVRYTVHYLEADNLAETTLNYAKKINANLISIVTKKETEPSKIWLGPLVSQLVADSSIPILWIPSDKDFVYDS